MQKRFRCLPALCFLSVLMFAAFSAFAVEPELPADITGHTEPWIKQGLKQSYLTDGHQNNDESGLPFNWEMRSELAAHNTAYAKLLTYGLSGSGELKCLETYQDEIWTVIFEYTDVTYVFTFYARTGTLIDLIQK